MATKKERPAPPPRRPAAKPVPGPGARGEMPKEELRKRISEAAYYRAKQRGFAPGHELEDWISAEAEVRQRMEGAA